MHPVRTSSLIVGYLLVSIYLYISIYVLVAGILIIYETVSVSRKMGKVPFVFNKVSSNVDTIEAIIVVHMTYVHRGIVKTFIQIIFKEKVFLENVHVLLVLEH